MISGIRGPGAQSRQLTLLPRNLDVTPSVMGLGRSLRSLEGEGNLPGEPHGEGCARQREQDAQRLEDWINLAELGASRTQRGASSGYPSTHMALTQPWKRLGPPTEL